MKDLARTFFALWYLLGWLSHVYLGLRRPHLYRGFGETALLPQFDGLWRSQIMPRIRLFALLLAVFELATGLLMIGRGAGVKIGLLMSMGFNLFLVQLGLAAKTGSRKSDFLQNRLANLVFLVGQLPLLWGHYDRSIPEIVLQRLEKR